MTESRISGTSHRSKGTSNLYITDGDTIGDGDLLSADLSKLRDSGLELSIRSGETHLITGLGLGGTTLHAKMM